MSRKKKFGWKLFGGPCVDERCRGRMHYKGGIMVCDKCETGMRPEDYKRWLTEADDDDDDDY